MSRLSQSLVAVQVAFCVVLLISSALFVRTVFNLQQVDLGFDKTRLLLFSVDAFSAGYKTDQFTSLHQKIAARIGAVPGVPAVGVSTFPWFSGSDFPTKELSLKNSTLSARDTPPAGWNAAGSVRWNAVGSDFFAAYGIPILSGRSFNTHDKAGGPKVVIVNQTLVREYFGGANPVGQHILLDGDREIVGVVRDAKQSGFDLRGATAPMAFLPFSEDIRNHAFYAVRTESEPATMLKEIRRAVANVNLNVPLFMVSTQEERIEGFFLKERMFAWVAGYIGVVTLSLAYVGLYGLISATVVRRTSEIGVRMALGAMPGTVLRMILRDSLSIVVVGLVMGIAAAYAASQLISSMLFGLSPNDSLTYGGVAIFLICVALFACWLPARRAAKVDPMVALRCE
jgi:predicted permease